MDRFDAAPFRVAGPASTDQERAALKQVLFLLRYRARLLEAVADADAPIDAPPSRI